MTNKEINDILYLHRNKCSELRKVTERLVMIRHAMRTLPTANYEKERVQGGKDNEHLIALIDRERELCLQVAKLSVEIDNAFTGAGRLILLLDNKDKDRDVLYAVYLYGKSYFDVAKEFGYDVDYVRVKIHKAKNKLVNITNSKGFPKEFFSD